MQNSHQFVKDQLKIGEDSFIEIEKTKLRSMRSFASLIPEDNPEFEKVFHKSKDSQSQNLINCENYGKTLDPVEIMEKGSTLNAFMN
jgi:hypothetical protein